MADTRIIDVNLGISGHKVRIHFRLTCDARAQLVGEQTFRISAPGQEPIDIIPIGATIVNHAEGFTTTVAIVRGLSFGQVYTRLRKLPNVSRVRTD
jgi:hypothetical protein